MLKKLSVVFLALLLSACGSQFAYNNMDWLIHWYIDDFIELTDAQEEAFDGHFERWQHWHRKQELIKYENHLKSVRATLERGELNKEKVLHNFDLAREHFVRLRSHIGEDIAVLSETMSEEQINKMFDTLEEQHQEDEKKRKEMKPEELQEHFEDAFQEQMSGYFGRLTKSQKQLVNQGVINIIPNRLEWIKYRRNILNSARQLMLNRNDNPDYKADFLTLLDNPEHYQHQTYIDNNEHNRQVFAQMVVDIYPTLTAKQRKRMFRKIDNLIEDLAELREDD